ncbi:hypothetical protein DPMN_103709 [Dreissena polymorpha]|uniref:Uncharacterized protein n=1 Tax=Dreissena polymorpha TaxID=45954 RepID=A0A9D4JZF1_DREPO|nr:hypothetical protein DPMN_103709 [Dreissena polymorpha]
MLFSNDKKADIDSSTKFVNYLSIAHVQSIYSSQTLKHILHFDWSYPVRLSANESGVRMTLSLVVKKSNLNSVQSCHQNDTGEKNFGADATNSSDQGLIKFENVIDQPSGNTNVECVTEEEIVNIEALCVTAQEERGVTYLTVKIDNAPTCFIQNHCNFPLYIGQAMMNLTLKGNNLFL